MATTAKLWYKLDCLQDSIPRLSGTIFTLKENNCKCLVCDLGYVYKYKLLILFRYLEVFLFFHCFTFSCNVDFDFIKFQKKTFFLNYKNPIIKTSLSYRLLSVGIQPVPIKILMVTFLLQVGYGMITLKGILTRLIPSAVILH